MARNRIEGTQLQNLEEVDAVLRRIGAIDRDIALAESAANEKIDAIKAELKAGTEVLLATKKGLETAIKEYCTAHKPDFAKAKTRVLTFGEVGFRSSTKIILAKKGKEIVAALMRLGFDACIRNNPKPDKEAMKKLTDEQLKDVGARRQTGDVFGYTVYAEKIREAA